MKNINVLYVDDELNNLNSFIACFRRDFNVLIANSAEEAKNVINENDIHVLITDQRMPGASGTILLSEAHKSYPDITRIMLTGYTDFEALVEAINIGYLYKYIEKPWNTDHLKKTIEEAHEVCMLKRQKELYIKELRETNDSLEKALKNIK